MATVKEKSLPLAIGLNIVLPGLGYMYMGKVILGLGALVMVSLIVLFSGLLFVVPAWLFINIIMAIDMVIFFNKQKAAAIAENTKKCPYCAELIQKDAIICRFCHANFADKAGT